MIQLAHEVIAPSTVSGTLSSFLFLMVHEGQLDSVQQSSGASRACLAVHKVHAVQEINCKA